jgi:hypothetical protein
MTEAERAEITTRLAQSACTEPQCREPHKGRIVVNDGSLTPYQDIPCPQCQRIAEAIRQGMALVEQDGPGHRWVCQTCGFTVMKAFLRASDGAVGPDTREVEDVCPNDGTSLRRLTWKEDAAAAYCVGLEQMKRADAAEAALARVTQERGEGEDLTVAEKIARGAGEITPSRSWFSR